jgi:gliding motility-associated-like protein
MAIVIYFVNGIDAFGCVGRDTVRLGIKPLPAITVTEDTAVCNTGIIPLSASGGVTYNWSPATGLSNPNIATPIATVNNSITYTVLVTGANFCSKRDSVIINVAPPPIYSVTPPTVSCAGTPVQLQASGGDQYLWLPANGLSAANIPNPIASPGVTTPYVARVISTACRDTAFLPTAVIVTPRPSLSVNKSNDISCSIPFAQLLATGANAYNWFPATGLSATNIPNPVASPSITTSYYVTATGVGGCTSTDSVIVNVQFTGKGMFSLPGAFTPNGDGVNDCYGLQYWGHIQQLDFRIFDRWGRNVFATKNPAICWDGRYLGKTNPGNYVYYINATTRCGPVKIKGNVLLIR